MQAIKPLALLLWEQKLLGGLPVSLALLFKTELSLALFELLWYHFLNCCQIMSFPLPVYRYFIWRNKIFYANNGFVACPFLSHLQYFAVEQELKSTDA